MPNDLITLTSMIRDLSRGIDCRRKRAAELMDKASAINLLADEDETERDCLLEAREAWLKGSKHEAPAERVPVLAPA